MAYSSNIETDVKVSYSDKDPDTGEGISGDFTLQENASIDVFLEGGYQQKVIARAIAAAIVSDSFVSNLVPNPLPQNIPTLVCGLTIPEPTVLSGIWPLPT
jgi:hypothetical protein